MVLVGSATRTARWFSALPKEYRALVEFGTATDTLDREGTVTATGALPANQDVQRVLPECTGRISQIPPAYSALKVQGRRAYEMARAGEKPMLASRTVEVQHLSMQPVAGDSRRWIMEVSCGSGTYIRALARDIAEKIGTHAHLVELQRLAVGPFTLDDAVTPEDLKKHRYPRDLLVDTGTALARLGTLGTVSLTHEAVFQFSHGQPLVDTPPPADHHTAYRVTAPDGSTIGVAEWVSGKWRSVLVFPQNAEPPENR